MFERFTDGARRAIVFAHDEALSLHHGSVGSEHLLLGLLREGTVVSLLASLDVGDEQLRERILERVGEGSSPPLEHLPFSTGCKSVMELALRQTLEMGWDAVGPDHLLLAIVQTGDGVAASVLEDLGAGVGDVTRLVLSRSERAPGAEPEELWAGPACPECGSEVAVTAVFRQVTVPDEQEDATRSVTIVFCKQCSRTLGVLPGT